MHMMKTCALNTSSSQASQWGSSSLSVCQAKSCPGSARPAPVVHCASPASTYVEYTAAKYIQENLGYIKAYWSCQSRSSRDITLQTYYICSRRGPGSALLCSASRLCCRGFALGLHYRVDLHSFRLSLLSSCSRLVCCFALLFSKLSLWFMILSRNLASVGS